MAEDADVAEYVLFNKRDAKVYQVPPATSATGHRAAEWKEAIWRGNVRIVTHGKTMTIRLLDTGSETLPICLFATESRPAERRMPLGRMPPADSMSVTITSTVPGVNLEEELSSLSSSSAMPMQDGANRSTKDAALASLRARIQEVQESDRGRSASELIYLAVCAGFQRAGYLPVQSLQAGGRVDLGSKLLNEDLLTSRIHSEDVLGAVEDHLTQSMPGGMAAKNSAALQQTVLLPQFNLGQAYAMTIQYGYVLRRAQSRLQLERSLHPSREGLDSLRSYLKRIGPGMFQDAMVSVEAHVAAKLQVEGVFGDLQMLKGQLMKSIESRRSSGRDTGAMLQEAVSAGEVASLLLGASDVRRLLLEAAAFGALLWEAESKASELASLVPSKQPRLSDFGVQADGDGNPVIPESD
eukprot:s6335_g1.t1